MAEQTATVNSAGEKLVIRREYNASREAVYQAWTDPSVLKSWFAPSPEHQLTLAELDVRVGGAYRFTMVNSKDEFKGFGVYREVDPNRRLVFTWRWEDGIIEPAETVVTVELRDHGVGTELTLTHEKLSSAESKEAHNHGWSGCLDSLGRFLDS